MTQLAQQPHLAATQLIREKLATFHIPGRPMLRPGHTRREAGRGPHGISDGYVLVEATVQRPSGPKVRLDFPVLIRDGSLEHPSVFMHEGETRVLTQQALDDVFDRKQITYLAPGRSMFNPPRAPGESRPDLWYEPQRDGWGMPRMASDAWRRRLRQGGSPGQGLAPARENAPPLQGVGPNAGPAQPKHRGHEMTLAADTVFWMHGGARREVPKGAKVKVLRDVAGDGTEYLVYLHDLCRVGKVPAAALGLTPARA